MQINKHGSFYIRNGWPTKIIDAMDIQGRSIYIFSPNNELSAVDQIGIGRVMVKALRYWAAVLGITVETKTQQGVLHTLTGFGEMIAQYDSYSQRAGTLWFLHRNLSRSIEEATAWSWAFNMYTAKSSTKDEFVSAFYAFVQTSGGKYAKSAIEKEFDCFKNTYVSDKAFDLDKILEEDTIPFFAPRGCWSMSAVGVLKRDAFQQKIFPYMYSFTASSRTTRRTYRPMCRSALIRCLKKWTRWGNIWILAIQLC